jgi:hypothetical protein
MKTRRKFLLTCSAAMASLALAPASIFASPELVFRRSRSLDQISYDAFVRQVGSTFRVGSASESTVELTLIKAPLVAQTRKSRGGPTGDASHEKFSLIFRGPGATPLASTIYAFEHGSLGHFEMQIGPVGLPDGNYVRYEAVFNRRPVSDIVRIRLPALKSSTKSTSAPNNYV